MDDLKHLQYCPPNITLSQVWVNHGVSQCFMDTVSSSVLFGFIFLFGTIELFMYRKYGTPVEGYQLRPSKLYNFQIFLLIFVPLIKITHFILESFVYKEHHIYGFMVSYLYCFFVINYFEANLIFFRSCQHHLLSSVISFHGVLL